MEFGLKKEDLKVKKRTDETLGIPLKALAEEEKVDKYPRVVNIKDCNDYDVVVGRESIFGNPFFIGTHGTRDEVIEKFEEYLLSNDTLMTEVRAKLKGKVLACSCSPLKCHADVLLKYANPELFNKNKPKL